MGEERGRKRRVDVSSDPPFLTPLLTAFPPFHPLQITGLWYGQLAQ